MLFIILCCLSLEFWKVGFSCSSLTLTIKGSPSIAVDQDPLKLSTGERSRVTRVDGIEPVLECSQHRKRARDSTAIALLMLLLLLKRG